MLLQCLKGYKLSANEQKVVEYINSNAELIPDMTIADIAGQAMVSVSTVTRAIQKCGINKLKDIRYQVSGRKQIWWHKGTGSTTGSPPERRSPAER